MQFLKSKSRRRLQFQALEDRSLLAADLVVDFNDAPPEISRFVVVGEDVYFAIDSGEAVEIWKYGEDEHQFVRRDETNLPPDVAETYEFETPVVFHEVDGKLLFSSYQNNPYDDVPFANEYLSIHELVGERSIRVDAISLIGSYGFWSPASVVAASKDFLIIQSDSRIHVPGGSFAAGESISCHFFKPAGYHIAEDGVFVTQTCFSNTSAIHFWVTANKTTVVEYNPGLTTLFADTKNLQFSDSVFIIPRSGGPGVRFEPIRSEAQWIGRIDRELVLFAGNDEIHGNEPWVSDGTAEGTQLLKDINPTGSSDASFVAFLSDGLLVSADDGINGQEIWFTDGTTTRLVSDILSGANGSRPIPIPAQDGLRPSQVARAPQSLFSAIDEIHGREVWVSDGTPDGTMLLADMTAGGDSRVLSTASLADGRLLLAIQSSSGVPSSIWVTDYTPGGTSQIIGFTSGTVTEFSTSKTQSKIFSFRTSDGTVWRSDGTARGTNRIVVDTPRSKGVDLQVVGVLSGDLIVTTTDLSAGKSTFWRVNQTSGEAVEMASVEAQVWFEAIVVEEDRLLIHGRTVTSSRNASGNLFWLTADAKLSTAGSYGGEADFLVTDSSVLLPSSVGLIDIPLDGRGTANEITVRTDEVSFIQAAAADQTVYALIDEYMDEDRMRFLTRLVDGRFERIDHLDITGDDIPFYALHGEADHLYLLDQTNILRISAETEEIVQQLQTGYDPFIFYADLDRFFWFDQQRVYQYPDQDMRLWVSDGTTEPQRLGSLFSSVKGVVAVDDTIYFHTKKPKVGFMRQLWRTDGTVDGTKVIGEFSDISDLVVFGNTLYFAGDDGVGRQLRKVNETGDGTVLVDDSTTMVQSIFATDDTLYFAGDDGVTGLELRKLVPPPTRLLGDVNDDGKVSVADLELLSAQYGQQTDLGFSGGDFDGNGLVDFTDFLLLADNFMEGD